MSKMKSAQPKNQLYVWDDGYGELQCYASEKELFAAIEDGDIDAKQGDFVRVFELVETRTITMTPALVKRG